MGGYVSVCQNQPCTYTTPRVKASLNFVPWVSHLPHPSLSPVQYTFSQGMSQFPLALQYLVSSPCHPPPEPRFFNCKSQEPTLANFSRKWVSWQASGNSQRWQEAGELGLEKDRAWRCFGCLGSQNEFIPPSSPLSWSDLSLIGVKVPGARV